jgi:Zn-dependent metalloprotease
MADVVSALVRQWSLGPSVDEADWLLGGAIFTPGIEMDAMRSMKAPGTAYDNSMHRHRVAYRHGRGRFLA